MSVTDIKIDIVRDENKPNLVGLASCVVDYNIRLNNIKIMKHDRYRNVYLPSYKTADGQYQNICEFVGIEQPTELFKEIKQAYFDLCKDKNIEA